MSKKLAYERYYWFHGQIKASQYPNARKLSERFEISAKQAQRDIEFMRDRLNAPIVYKSEKRGYELEDHSYELPPVWFQEDELLALCLALRLASAIPDRSIKDSLHQLLEKFLAYRSLGSIPTLKDIGEKVSVKNTQYYRVKESVFHKIIDSLFRNESVMISYYSPHTEKRTERIIRPLHLLCYMGSWHIIAFCTLKNELRDFAISRIRDIAPNHQKVELPSDLPAIRNYIDRSFGLMVGQESVEVCLKFDREIAEWISEQIWHNSQEIFANEDGSICLKFPVASFKEIRREILKYGGDVEVLWPQQLRQEIKIELEKMKMIYR